VNVTVVSVGGGLAYGSLGVSHHATEDLAILRSIPNMKVFAPGDTKEAYEITRRIIQEDLGPVYLRIGRAGEATLHSDESLKKLELGKALSLFESESKKIALLSTGGMLEIARDVHDLLMKELNTDSSVYSFHTIKPFDKDAVIKIMKQYDHVFTLEEHSIVGGFSSAVMESLIGEKGIDVSKLRAFALPSEFTSKVGDQNYLRDHYGISTNKIFNSIKNTLN
jgi:transketolase